MKYRSEIDGLRAVAVIPVIFFHAGISVFSGGFVGVDVFFVISGYLITTIILSEMEKEKFSIINFYERRARRILPALFLVMLVSLPFAWFLLLPGEMVKFSESLIAVSSFVSNIYFWSDAGYWETANELKPMLHTWSLAVEEQYYVLFPLFLMLMWRYRKRWILVSFILIVGVSLAVAQWGAYNKPTATFYLLPTRVWELGVGTLIAFYFLYIKREAAHNKFTEETLSIIGLFMILYAIFNFDETTPFPSFYALIPTVGAGLIILFATGNNLVGRLLSNKLIVAIGLISYSAYLWHQPLLAFSRNASLTDPIALTVIAALSLPLAYLSWRYVEKPFRTKNVMSRKTIFSFSVIGLLAFISIGLLGKMTAGLPSRYDDNSILKFVEYDWRDTYRSGDCFLSTTQNHTAFKDECFSKSKGENSIALWGDSHLAALYHGLKFRLDNLTQLTAGACPPILGFKTTKNLQCFDNNNFILSKIEDLKPKLLILHANWLTHKTEFGLEKYLSETILSVKAASPKTKIVIIGGVPQWKPSLPKVLLINKHNLNEMNYVYSSSYETIQNTDQILEKVANENEITFISLLNLFCMDEKCLSSVKQGEKYEPFTWDYGHVTEFGSLLVSERIVPIILQEK